MIKVLGLGLIQALHSPHYDFEKHRKTDLKEMMKKTSSVAIALDNCCAVEIIDEKYKIVSSRKDANAYKVFWKKNKFHEEIIKQEKMFLPLSEILNK